MKRKSWVLLIPVIVLLCCAGVFLARYQVIAGKIFPRSAEVLDFSDRTMTAEEYKALAEQNPGKEIVWSVPFQGASYAQNTESITVKTLTAEEAEYLDALPNLKRVEATECTDYDALLFLQQRRPECVVHYLVPLGDEMVDSQTATLACSTDEFGELEAALKLLPAVNAVNLSGAVPDAATLESLKTEFPAIAWHVEFTLGGAACSEDTEELNLSGRNITLKELQQAIPLMPALRLINLTGCGLSDEEKRTLIADHRAISILCTLTFLGEEHRTDETELDLTDKSFTLEDLQAVLSCFYQLKRLTLGTTELADEELGALNEAYPATDIVWNIKIGHVRMPTDSICFFPAAVDEVHMPDNEELQKLRYCTKLQAIDIGHSTVTDCSWLNYTPEVKYLILADTPLSDITAVGSLKKLVYLELFCTQVTDYSPLLGCTALQDLNLGQTHGDPEPLSHMTWLHMLQWNEGLANEETRDRVQALVDELPDTSVLLPDGIVNIDGNWRSLANYYIFRSIIGGSYRNQECIYGYWGADSDRIMNTVWQPVADVAGTLTEIIQRRMAEGEEIPGIKNRSAERVQQLLDSMSEYCGG